MTHKPLRLIGVSIEERFLSKAGDRPDGQCWQWSGALHPTLGYGCISVGGNRTESAHRVAYELYVGPIPDGLQIDHLCRNRGCVNPAHLEAVTQAENIRRGIWKQRGLAWYAAQTHCRKGHPYTGDRDYLGHRMCKTCRRENDQRKNARRKGKPRRKVT